jgi:phosphoenolpyruvate-protein kinase (PTS system EI component)
MDNETAITILVFTGLSSLCICCICIQALRFQMRELAIERMREISKKKREKLRNNYLVHPEAENLRHSELV